ncbi:MAG: hypothetical protein ACI92S_003527 [Planctomycetaceae bacterium]|jgi:hypothetical protein
MGPLGRKRDEEAIWGNLPKTRTNHFLIGSVTSGPLPQEDADVYEGRVGATLYLQNIYAGRELL